MRQFIRIIEMAQSSLLYHTTTAYSAIEILQSGSLKPGKMEGSTFVSFSEIPLVGNFDISGTDVSIGFHPYAFWGKIEKVIYSEEWYNSNMDKASYIAGHGWVEQWFFDGDDDDEEQARDAAQFDAFMDKESEMEWVSLHPYETLTFNKDDVVICITKRDDPEFVEEIRDLGYQHVKILLK